MARIYTLEIRCQHCGAWLNSGISFGDTESFDSASLSGNKQQCTNLNCRKMTGCNKENMRFRSADGGFKGIDT